ncbi:MAG TPA: site-specific integrase [Nevskiaceae bacterium]|nr:site-specific integrase [Nevskiaceae bacterium]
MKDPIENPQGELLFDAMPEERVAAEAEALDRPDIPAHADEERLAQLKAASRSKNTQRGYRSDWKAFETWCKASGRVALPATPATVERFIVAQDRAGRKYASICRRMSGIRDRHCEHGHASPTSSEEVKKVLRGLRRDPSRPPPNPKIALTAAEVLMMLAQTRKDATGVRDRALIVLGYQSSRRRSEISSLDLADVSIHDAGIEVRVRRSKTDQEGEGLVNWIGAEANPAACPVRLLRAWLEVRGDRPGPLFWPCRRGGHPWFARLSGQAICEIVQALAAKVGIDPARVGAHSLRAGLITEAMLAGHSVVDVMKHTGHKSVGTLSGYVRPRDPFRKNVAAGLLSGARHQSGIRH